ncbi:hypothetical protein [Embleya scabrispora]|uniref:hypothetical protein n=1 Tax=Embleya scabrispora TaxID=159449 RepID=UPI00036577C8|nr:hypothetical protein [Embleya scabrispora]
MELLRAHPQRLAETKAVLTRTTLRHPEEHADAMIALSARLLGSDRARAAMTAFLGR